MFWSLVRPDRILPPLTRSAAVTSSLEADKWAIGMITCECSRRRLLEFDRLINKASAFFRAPNTRSGDYGERAQPASPADAGVQRASPAFDERCKGGLDFAVAADVEDFDLLPRGRSRSPVS